MSCPEQSPEGQEQREIEPLSTPGKGIQIGQEELDFSDHSPAIGGSPSELLRVPFHLDVGS